MLPSGKETSRQRKELPRSLLNTKEVHVWGLTNRQMEAQRISRKSLCNYVLNLHLKKNQLLLNTIVRKRINKCSKNSKIVNQEFSILYFIKLMRNKEVELIFIVLWLLPDHKWGAKWPKEVQQERNKRMSQLITWRMSSRTEVIQHLPSKSQLYNYKWLLTRYMAVELDSSIYYSSYIMDEKANRLSNWFFSTNEKRH